MALPARPAGATATAALLMMFLSSSVFATAPGLDAYRSGKFEDAYGQFQQTLKTHPESRAEDKLQFDSGAAAYKLKDYSKAMESFSQALLSRDIGLQSKGHYNLGNTLYQRGEAQKSDDKKLSDWTNALDHYEQTLKLDPQNKEAKDNYDYVKKKIEELKNKKQDQPSPSPSPQQKNEQNKQDKQDKQQQQNQQTKSKKNNNNTTTEPTAATRAGPAAAERSKAITRSAVTRPVRESERPTGKERSDPGEERAAKKPAAATKAWRDSFPLSGRRQATRPTAFTVARGTARSGIAEPWRRTK